jgi:queuosine precursor transporter
MPSSLLHRLPYWTIPYIGSIVLVNWLFVTLPMVPTPWGDWTFANIVVGFVFILRDLAQRQLGHYVLIATAIGGLLTWITVDPSVALASVTAFMVAELADWAVYSFTKRPLHERILWSSALAAPLDTIVFQHMIDILTPAAFSLEAASKMLGAVAVWLVLRRRAPSAPDGAPAR